MLLYAMYYVSIIHVLYNYISCTIISNYLQSTNSHILLINHLFNAQPFPLLYCFNITSQLFPPTHLTKFQWIFVSHGGESGGCIKTFGGSKQMLHILKICISKVD